MGIRNSWKSEPAKGYQDTRQVSDECLKSFEKEDARYEGLVIREREKRGRRGAWPKEKRFGKCLPSGGSYRQGRSRNQGSSRQDFEKREGIWTHNTQQGQFEPTRKS